MKKLSISIAILIVTFFSSCTVYKVSSSSLSDQLNGNTVSKGYFPATKAVKGNDLQTIKCVDKSGKEKEIEVTYNTSVRIIKKDGSKTTFYLNTLLLKDSAIVGSKTHFFNAQIKPIPLSAISSIEVME